MVDMYSLGSVFFDMWWDYKRTYQERNKIVKEISQQKFEKEAMKELEQKNQTKKGKKHMIEFT
jgi:hypothetical protein